MPLVLPLLRLTLVALNTYETFKILKRPLSSTRDKKQPSQRAIQNRRRDMKGRLACWVIWVSWTICEGVLDRSIGILTPFYNEFKSITVFLLILTRNFGAEPIFLHVIRPFVKPYVATLDFFFDCAASLGGFMILLFSIPFHMLMDWWNGTGSKDADPHSSKPPSVTRQLSQRETAQTDRDAQGVYDNIQDAQQHIGEHGRTRTRRRNLENGSAASTVRSQVTAIETTSRPVPVPALENEYPPVRTPSTSSRSSAPHTPKFPATYPPTPPSSMYPSLPGHLANIPQVPTAPQLYPKFDDPVPTIPNPPPKPSHLSSRPILPHGHTVSGTTRERPQLATYPVTSVSQPSIFHPAPLFDSLEGIDRPFSDDTGPNRIIRPPSPAPSIPSSKGDSDARSHSRSKSRSSHTSHSHTSHSSKPKSKPSSQHLKSKSSSHSKAEDSDSRHDQQGFRNALGPAEGSSSAHDFHALSQLHQATSNVETVDVEMLDRPTTPEHKATSTARAPAAVRQAQSRIIYGHSAASSSTSTVSSLKTTASSNSGTTTASSVNDIGTTQREGVMKKQDLAGPGKSVPTVPLKRPLVKERLRPRSPVKVKQPDGPVEAATKRRKVTVPESRLKMKENANDQIKSKPIGSAHVRTGKLADGTGTGTRAIGTLRVPTRPESRTSAKAGNAHVDSVNIPGTLDEGGSGEGSRRSA